MIQSTSSTGASSGSNAINLGLQSAAQRSVPAGRDSLSLDQAGALQTALSDQPEIRSDVVERGRALAADPNYPSASVIGHVANLIANSADLSEDQT